MMESGTSESFHETKNFMGEMTQKVSMPNINSTNITFKDEVEICNVEEQLMLLQDKLHSLDSQRPGHFLSRSKEYIDVVENIWQLTEQLASKINNDRDPISSRARCFFQNAMDKLFNRFVDIMILYKKPVSVGPEFITFCSAEAERIRNSLSTEGTDDFRTSNFSETTHTSSDDPGIDSVDLCISSEEPTTGDAIDPSALSILNSIVKLMFVAKLDKVFCRAYVNLRRKAMNECLSAFHFKNFSVGEISSMSCASLDSLVKPWCQALKVFPRVYTSEQQLGELIFSEVAESNLNSCLIEISKPSLLRLLGFGKAVSAGFPTPEKLFHILDMYEVLREMLRDKESFLPKGYDGYLVNEYENVLAKLEEFAKCIINNLKSTMKSDNSKRVIAKGAVHPITRNVINYLKILSAYSGTLDMLYEDPNEKVKQFISLTTDLESFLETQSMLCGDIPLQNFFIMNNVCYMVEQIRDSDLSRLFGEEWLGNHCRKVRQYAASYERASWGPILDSVKFDKCYNSHNLVEKMVEKTFKGFNVAFGEMCRIQAGWKVSSPQLKEDLRISILIKVALGYRTLLAWSKHHRNRHVKYYSPDDVENCILELFEG